MYRKVKRANKETIAHIIADICILAAGALLYHLLSGGVWDFEFNMPAGLGTKIEFSSNSGRDSGFTHEATLYTEDGITCATFSGKITVDGTAMISIISNDDSSNVYVKKYTAENGRAIQIEVNNLTPYSYYTLRFSSQDAKKGRLLLTTDQALVERPSKPSKRPVEPVPAMPNI